MKRTEQLTEHEKNVLAQALTDYQEGLENADVLSDKELKELDATLSSIEKKLL